MSTTQAAPIAGLDLEEVNRILADAPAQEILRWAVDAAPRDRLALISAFGPGSAVLIHLLAELESDLPVVFVDTLHHFRETLDHVEAVRRRYDLDLRVYRPAESLEEFVRMHGDRLWEKDLQRYQQVAKVEPFRRATEVLDGWITGRRRDQAATRTALPVVEGGEKLRINPLVNWTRSDVWSYIVTNELPYNPLHDRGYASIGDAPLTSPIRPDEDERAGRWRGSATVECGIHLV
jgi:phosphoadenosine phosphosulfate reductase